MSDTDKAKQILDRWLEAVNAVDVETLGGLYHDEAVLIPTFRDRIHDTPDMIRDYFEALRDVEDLNVDLDEPSLHVQAAGSGLFVLGGNYGWRWVKEGQKTQRDARFSYVIDTTAAKPILHHHSSELPKV